MTRPQRQRMSAPTPSHGGARSQHPQWCHGCASGVSRPPWDRGFPLWFPAQRARDFGSGLALPAPEGQLIIGRQFIAGISAPPQFAVPAGRLNRDLEPSQQTDCETEATGHRPEVPWPAGAHVTSSVPLGREGGVWSLYPAMDCQAILTRSLRDRGLTMWFAECLRS